MKCSQCGKELAPTAKFCTNCGTRVVRPEEPKTNEYADKGSPGVRPEEARPPMPVPDRDLGPKAPAAKPEPKRRKSGKFILIAAGILAVAAVAGIAVGILKPRIEEAVKGVLGGYEEEISEEPARDALEEEEIGEVTEGAREEVSGEAAELVREEEAPEAAEPSGEENPAEVRESAEEEPLMEEPSEEEAEPSEEESLEQQEYILPESNSRYLTNEDLEGMTAEQCRLARNEIYARHGRIFQDEELQAYFESFDWYEPRVQPDAFQESWLNEYEVANRDLIVEYESQKGYR